MGRNRKEADITNEPLPEETATEAGRGTTPAPVTIGDEKQLLEKLKAANEKVAEASLVLKQADKEYDDAFIKMHEYLIATGKSATAEYPEIGKVRIDDGPFIPSVNKEHTDDLKAYLIGIGRGDLVKETVNHGSLKTFVNEMLDKGEVLPAFISVYKEPKLKQYFVK